MVTSISALSRAIIGLGHDIVEVTLGNRFEVGAAGEARAEQAGVLAGAALPGRARVADADRDAGGHAEPGVPGHLLALAPGQGAALGRPA